MTIHGKGGRGGEMAFFISNTHKHTGGRMCC